jgi:hypothetical protein
VLLRGVHGRALAEHGHRYYRIRDLPGSVAYLRDHAA